MRKRKKKNLTISGWSTDPIYLNSSTCEVDGTTYIGPGCPTCQDLNEVKLKAKILGYTLVKIQQVN